MGLNNKKYLDYAGLEKLVDMHAVVPHPQVEITSEGAYKIAFDEHGHITSKSPLTAADLGVENALHFVGISTTDPLSATGATIAGHTAAFVPGDICLYRDKITQDPSAGSSIVEQNGIINNLVHVPTVNGWIDKNTLDLTYHNFFSFDGLPGVTYTVTLANTGDVTACQFEGEYNEGDIYPLVVTKVSNTVYTMTALRNLPICVYGKNTGIESITQQDQNALSYEEFVYVGATGWEKLGDSDSYALKSIRVDGDDSYIIGGGALYNDIKLRHKDYTYSAAGIKSIGRDSGGHVIIGKDILVQSGGGGNHNHTTSTTIAKDTYVTGVTDTHTKLSINPTTAKVLNGLEEKLANLNTTSITGVSGSTTASKATAGTAVSVAKAGTEVVYGEANVGTEVTGLAKRAASTTKVGNANIATSATIIGNADVGDAVVYGTADVGSQVTVQDGKADVGSATRYGTANVGEKVSVATQATAQTKVGNADVGAAVVYGTADVGAQITVDAGKADVGNKVTVATRASSQTTVGNANVATAATLAGNADVGNKVSVLNSFSNTARSSGESAETDLFHVSVEENTETLVLTPRIISTGNTDITPAVKTATSIYGATSSTTKIYAVGGVTDITPAVASNRTVSFTPATAAPSTQTLTPAKAVSDASTKIYGVAGSIDITPAEEAPSTQTLTPAVASNRTKSFTPAKAADTSRKLTPAKAATATIYGAVESTTEIYGVTADQISIKPAVQSTKKIVPAVANGTITPYTFSNVTVPKAATAITVATGSVSVGGAGAAIMTGVDTTDLDVMTAAAIVKGTSGDVDVVDEVTATKNAAATFTGTTSTHTEGTHTHTLYTE